MADDNWQEWFERVWQYREEELYPALFGPKRQGIFTLQADMLTQTFKQESFDPRWLHYGVFEFEPSPSRKTWLYVTSGMSNDWQSELPNPETPSGLGCEFVLETPQSARWAIFRLLHAMAFQILLCHGCYPGRDPIVDYDRLPLRGSIRSEPSALTFLMLAPPNGFSRQAQLESGSFDFYQIVGITEPEASYARKHGGSALVEILQSHSAFPVTNPDRNSVVEFA
jgi:hypothetical protein